MSEINKGYYAIIPANIRYDNDIPSNAKLLYSEITALCNAKGYCWADNKYFAELYNVSDRTIYRWISQLIKKGYIFAEYKYKSGTKEIEKRYIKLTGNIDAVYEEECELGTDKNVSTYCQNCQGGGDKNVSTFKVDEINENIESGGDKMSVCGDKNVSTLKDDEINESSNIGGIKMPTNGTEEDYIYINNIYNNNLYNNILSCKDNVPVGKSADNSPIKDSKCLVINEIIIYLNAKCSTSYKTSSEKTKKYINARLNEGYSLADFKKVIDNKVIDWLIDDPHMSKYLRPQTLFGSNFESYLNQKNIPAINQNQQKKPANKFHNFIKNDNGEDLEALAEKRREKSLKYMAAQRSEDRE